MLPSLCRMISETILVVEDNDLLRNSIRKSLEAEGARVIAVGDGEGAMEALVREKPDLVLLDLTLGGTDDLHTLKEIRRTDRSLPVVLVSGRFDPPDPESPDTQYSDYISKPFHPEELVARVRRVLGRRSR